MPVLLWDASALAQRYAPEPGSQTVDALFTAVMPSEMVITILGYAETFAVLTRKRNRGTINQIVYEEAISALKLDVIYSPGFGVLDLAYDSILDGIELVAKHNINSTDAAILATYLKYAQSVLNFGSDSVLVASDQRLLRAGSAEGLHTVNPELLPAADVAGFLARFR